MLKGNISNQPVGMTVYINLERIVYQNFKGKFLEKPKINMHNIHIINNLFKKDVNTIIVSLVLDGKKLDKVMEELEDGLLFSGYTHFKNVDKLAEFLEEDASWLGGSIIYTDVDQDILNITYPYSVHWDKLLV